MIWGCQGPCVLGVRARVWVRLFVCLLLQTPWRLILFSSLSRVNDMCRPKLKDGVPVVGAVASSIAAKGPMKPLLNTETVDSISYYVDEIERYITYLYLCTHIRSFRHNLSHLNHTCCCSLTSKFMHSGSDVCCHAHELNWALESSYRVQLISLVSIFPFLLFSGFSFSHLWFHFFVLLS